MSAAPIAFAWTPARPTRRSPDSLSGVRSRLAGALLIAGAIASCGKDSGGAAAPHPEPIADTASVEPRAETGTQETSDEGEPRLELAAEFHRARFGLGSGFWVLGVVHNPHAERVTDVRLQVRLLDESEAVVGEADGRVDRSIEPGERAAVAVHVPQPVAHEQLRLAATAIADQAPAPEPLSLRLEHEAPQRADLGGWYILGKVENTGSVAVEGARVEIQGLDGSGQLLGIDWLELDPVAAGTTLEFDVGDLRYEEAPARFLLQIRGPASE
jgi:hypothetical protein